MAFTSGKKVLILGHIPPGFSERGSGGEFFRNKEQNDDYLKTFEDFGEIIMGHFYGHAHTDSFKLSKNSGAMFLTPSLCEMSRNPAMGRRFHFDDATKVILSYDQYWVDLSVANQQKQLNWLLEYSTDQSPYNLKDLTLKSMTEFVERLKTNNKLFEDYYKFNMASYPQAPCILSCKKVQFCALQYTYYDDFHKCIDSKTGFLAEI